MFFLLLSNLPQAQAAAPSARWGHRAVFVEDTSSLYIVGGAVSDGVDQLTNDVFVLPVSDFFFRPRNAICVGESAWLTYEA